MGLNAFFTAQCFIFLFLSLFTQLSPSLKAELWCNGVFLDLHPLSVLYKASFRLISVHVSNSLIGVNMKVWPGQSRVAAAPLHTRPSAQHSSAPAAPCPWPWRNPSRRWWWTTCADRPAGDRSTSRQSHCHSVGVHLWEWDTVILGLNLSNCKVSIVFYPL